MFKNRRSRNRYGLALLVSVVLLCLPSFAQSGKGEIAGSVVDDSGSVLKGAEVDLLPLGLTASTNERGQFEMINVPAGHYTLTTSFVGFQTHNEEVDVVAGKPLNLNEKLEVATASEQINVTGERLHGEAEAINQVRTSENIIDVLPSEVITSLPNANVADALGRLPGVVLERDEGEGVVVDLRGLDPRLTNVTIDGITLPPPEPTVRQIRLDVINSDLVDEVEINKTLSANQDADGIAGSVNLRTKPANRRNAVQRLCRRRLHPNPQWPRSRPVWRRLRKTLRRAEEVRIHLRHNLNHQGQVHQERQNKDWIFNIFKELFFFRCSWCPWCLGG